MFNRFFIILITIMLFCGAAESAELKLFLLPKITAGEKALTLGDIALVESDSLDAEGIKNLEIDSMMLSDGYVDKKEILTLIKNYTVKRAVIYGSAVHVINYTQDGENWSPEKNDFILNKGDRVQVIVNNGGVSLILKGTAVNEAKFNDIVDVKVEGSRSFSKILKGRVAARDIVEVNI